MQDRALVAGATGGTGGHTPGNNATGNKKVLLPTEGKQARPGSRHAAQVRCRRKSRPDIRLVATTPDLRWKDHRSAGKSDHRLGDVRAFQPALRSLETPAGHRADQADIGPRLGAVTGRRPVRNVIALFREAGEKVGNTPLTSEKNQ